jgi:hypothetical protein
VKRSGRDESTQVVIHMCMEAMLGTSLYSYPSQTRKMNAVSFFYCYVFSSTQLEKRAEQVLPGSEVGGEWRGWRGGAEKWPKQCMHI